MMETNTHSTPASSLPAQGFDLVGPASFAQKRWWFLHHYAPDTPVYHITVAYRLAGPLNITALEQSLAALIQRHEALRTTFCLHGGQVLQQVAPAGAFTLPLVAWPTTMDETSIKERLTAEAAQPFNLESGPLFRATLFAIAREHHILLLVFHHIIMDGWSLGVLFRELGHLYTAAVTGAAVPLPKLAIQYADFSAWQREQLSGDGLRPLKDYWLAKLAGAATTLELPADRPRPAVESYRGGHCRHQLSPDLTEKLERLARREGASLFMLLMAAFHALLHRYTGQTDLLVGTPIAGRNRTETEPLIGCFINTLVIHSRLADNPCFLTFLQQVRTTALEAFAHQDLPFEKLVEELHLKRDASRAPLFQVLFAMQNFGDRSLKLPGIEATRLECAPPTSPFDQTWYAYPKPDGLELLIEYNTDLYNPDRIERMVRHFQVLLEGILAQPSAQISDLPLLTEAERHQVLVAWNDTNADYPRDQCVHQLFEAQVERTPDAIALVFESQSLTYRELNDQSNRLAHYLRALGATRETPVGICAERSLEMMVGLLGILKAGGYYVPLDPELPEARLDWLITAVSLKTILVQNDRTARRFCTCQAVDLVPLDGPDAPWRTAASTNPKSGSQPDDLAYLMFTSGSTGAPKGVHVPHRGIARLVITPNYVQLDSREIILQFAPLSFDASTYEIWGSLLNGARLVVMPPGLTSLQNLGRVIREQRISTLWLTAALFRQMVDEEAESLGDVRQLLAGGEALDLPSVKKFLALPRRGTLINGYGPTENTTFTCCCRINDLSDLTPFSVPIGRPINRTAVFLLDASRQPVPVGVAGELYTGGDGLARGYLNDPELTSAKFVPDPFSNTAGSRLYRTGDHARWLPDGRLEFLGRIDNQVKIRGYRIELGEIEAVLRSCAEVKEAAVVVRMDPAGEKSLAAFVVWQEGVPGSTDALREQLRQKLPNYMIPAAIVSLDCLPLTPNGKLDRKALATHPLEITTAENDFTPPQTELERQLAEIWKEVLRLDSVSTTDSFFDLGGHSLLAARLAGNMEKQFNRSIPLSAFFQHPTVARMARWLVESHKNPEPSHPLQGSGRGTPLFHVPGMAGVEFLPPGVAAELGKVCRYYDGFRYPGLNGEKDPAQSIEDIAASLIHQLNQVYPEGPMCLSGFSMGGTVAFEMARQLRQTGRHVQVVLLVDSFICGAVLKRTPTQALAVLWYRLQSLPPRERVALFGRLLGNKFKWLYHRRQPVADAQDHIPGLKGKDPHSIDARILHASHAAWTAYRPPPYAGRVVLFKPSQSSADKGLFHPMDPLNGWGKAVGNRLELVIYPGDHTTFLYEPGSTRLGHLISLALHSDKPGSIPQETVNDQQTHSSL